MPKEYLHFRIAERTASLLAGSRFEQALAARPEALLLGSVFHDALYYLETPGSSDAPGLLRLPHLLHGQGGRDTHTLLRALARQAATTGDPAASAFLVGAASHLRADATLHPLVFHLTGQYYNDPRATERHRLLESCMDLAASGARAELRRRRLSRMLHACDPVPLAPLGQLATLSKRGEREISEGLARAWRTFARMQGLALSPAGTGLARLRPLLPGRLHKARSILALFYPPASLVQDVLDRLARPLDYRHPVTGQAHRAALSELMESAARSAALLCKSLEPATFGDPGEPLPERGPCLDTGLPETDSSNASHFAEPPFPPL